MKLAVIGPVGLDKNVLEFVEIRVTMDAGQGLILTAGTQNLMYSCS